MKPRKPLSRWGFFVAPGRAQAMVVAACLLLAGLTAMLRRPRVDERLAEALPTRSTGQGFTTSGTCLACHPAQYASWHESYHRTMTQVATPKTVLAPFDGEVLESRGFEWRLERRKDELWAVMPDPVWFEQPVWLMRLLDETWPEQPPQVDARVVMSTGSHHMQTYWVRRSASDPSLRPDDGSMLQVPWVWLIDEERWVPNQDSFLTPPTRSIGGVAHWNDNCSQCHSVGTEPRGDEGDRRFATRTAELGIACEACHGPAERHATHYRSPWRRYVRYLRLARDDAADPTIVNPARLEQSRSLEVCGQCHSFGEWLDRDRYRRWGVPFVAGDHLHAHRKVFRYDDDPTDPLLRELMDADSLALDSRFWPDGTSRVAGREYNAVLASTHFTDSEITCLSCHSMHEYEDRDAQLTHGAAGDRACVGCHQDYEEVEIVVDHTRHRPESPGSECMNCHMPRTTYGLFAAMRSHRIDSPRLRVAVDSGRPNACNLCHLDQTLEWTGRHLQEWYGQPPVELDRDDRDIGAGVLWTLKGDAVQRTITAWHMGWEPAREASGDAWMVPYLAQLLLDPYSATRLVAYRSLRALPEFRDFRYDYLASTTARGGLADEVAARGLRYTGAMAAEPRLLIGEDGRPDGEQWLRLLAGRDTRPITIRE